MAEDKKTTAAPGTAAPGSAPPAKEAGSGKDRSTGYHMGDVDTVISVEEVTRQVEAISQDITVDKLDAMVPGESYLTISGLRAGYGQMEILHDINLRVGRKQSLCLIGPNGAGKSTILHAIFGFNNIFAGKITVGHGADQLDITNMSPNEKLSKAGIAYILAGQISVPRHDGRRKPLDGRLPEGQTSRGENRRRKSVRQISPAGGKAQTSGQGFVGWRAAAAGRFRAHW